MFKRVTCACVASARKLQVDVMFCRAVPDQTEICLVKKKGMCVEARIR